ncbi:MAG: AraC family transcriptional regulator [Acidobacteriota bacterium]
MPRSPDTRLSFRTLYKSPIVDISDYRCAEDNHSPGHEEESESNSIVLMRRGAFAKHFGKRKVTADVNQAVFFSNNSVYRISHPTECGDRGTTFTLAPRILNDIVREIDPGVDEHPEQPFAFVTGPCDTKLFWRHRELVQRLERADWEPLEHLWVDVATLQLVADVLGSAFESKQKPAPSRRSSTNADHAKRAEAAKAFLAVNIAEPVMLNEIAREVGASPFNFARIFLQQTGLPVHRYLTLLRLRSALERISDGEDDLTVLALDLGFSSHSHFTDVFKREFGMTPSEIRGKLKVKALREMSKNLIVSR